MLEVDARLRRDVGEKRLHRAEALALPTRLTWIVIGLRRVFLRKCDRRVTRHIHQRLEPMIRPDDGQRVDAVGRAESEMQKRIDG